MVEVIFLKQINLKIERTKILNLIFKFKLLKFLYNFVHWYRYGNWIGAVRNDPEWKSLRTGTVRNGKEREGSGTETEQKRS